MSNIHKMLGYGFVNIAPNELNPNGFIFHPELYDLSKIPGSTKNCIYYKNNCLCVISPSNFLKWRDIETNVPTPSELPFGFHSCRYLRDRRSEKKSSCAMLSIFFDLYDIYIEEKCQAVKWRMEHELKDIAEQSGFNCIQEVLENTETYVPEAVIQLCEYTALFIDSNIVKSMKPVITDC